MKNVLASIDVVLESEKKQKENKESRFAIARKKVMVTGRWLLASTFFMMGNIFASGYYAALLNIWNNTGTWTIAWVPVVGTRIGVSFCQIMAVLPPKKAERDSLKGSSRATSAESSKESSTESQSQSQA